MLAAAGCCLGHAVVEFCDARGQKDEYIQNKACTLPFVFCQAAACFGAALCQACSPCFLPLADACMCPSASAGVWACAFAVHVLILPSPNKCLLPWHGLCLKGFGLLGPHQNHTTNNSRRLLKQLNKATSLDGLRRLCDTRTFWLLLQAFSCCLKR